MGLDIFNTLTMGEFLNRQSEMPLRQRSLGDTRLLEKQPLQGEGHKVSGR